MPGATTYQMIVAAQQLTDAALLQQIAAGDRTAMHALYARHNRRVFRFIARIVGDPHTADDVVSQVFVDVYRAADRFEGRSQVLTWLLSIARNKALAVLRQRPLEHLSDEQADSIPDLTESADRKLERDDVAGLMRNCLLQLSDAHREIIDLVYYQEMSVEEVARIVGIPRNTVKTRMFYARKQLARLIERAGGRRSVAV